jgi:copper type II ascorbate-dependent monooxygenase-like protein
MRQAAWSGFVLLAGIVACSSDGGDEPAGAGASGASTGAGNNTSDVTFWEDVAPIVYDNCVSCHVAGSIGPFELVTYEDAKTVGPLMEAETAARRMPPWHADNSGACNTYDDARWLSDEQIATFAAWVAGGYVEGDPANAPQIPEPETLAEVTRTLDTGADYTPNDSIADDYRCFVVDPQITEDMYLTAYEMRPGEPRIVHHVILFSLDTATAEQQAVALDADEPGPGYTCFGGAGVSASQFIGGWAPGTPVTRYPADTGVLLPQGRKAVMQIHYNTVNGVFPDHTRMDVTLAAHVPHVATIAPIADFSLNLPPGMTGVEESASQPNPAPIPVQVLGVFPHMHQLGTKLHSSAGDQCLVDVPAWDFHWQQFYFYEEPVTVMPGDALSITCTYDTMSKMTTTTWGESTQDEMCLNFVYVTY